MRLLVGRASERELLRSRVRSAPARSATVLLTGSAGVGTSTLLHHALDEAHHAGMTTLPVVAAFGDADVPFATLRRALVSWADSPSALGELLPALTALADRPEPGRRLIVEQAFEAALDRLAFRAPGMLAIDDLHDADRATVGLVCEAVRRAPTRGLVILVATRWFPDLDTATAHQLGRLIDEGRAERIGVGPLTRDDVIELVRERTGAAPSERFCDELVERSGGWPLFVTAIVDDLAAHGALRVEAALVDATEDVSRAVPERVTIAVLDRVARLGPCASAMARAMAVAGRLPARHVGILAAVGGALHGEAEAALDLLVGAGVLELDPHSTYQFTQDVVRAALLSDVGPARSRRLHLAIGQAYASNGVATDGDVLEAAEHLRAAALGRHPLATSVFERAARQVLHSTPEVALTWFREALAAAPPGSGSTVRLQLGMVEALNLTGSHTAAAELATQAVERATEPSDREQAIVAAARSRLNAGNLDGAAGLLDAELAGGPVASPVLLVERARIANWQDEFDLARALLRQAIALGASPNEATIRAVGAFVDVATGRFAAAAITVDELRDELASLDPERRATVRTTVATISSFNFKPAVALAVTDGAHGMPMASHLHATRAMALVRQGRYVEAVDAARAGIGCSDVPGGPGAALCWPALIEASVELDLLSDAHVAWNEAKVATVTNVTGILDTAVASLLLAERRLAEAVALLDGAVVRQRASGRVNVLIGLLAARVRASLRLRDRAAAARSLDELLAFGEEPSAVALTMHQLSARAAVHRDADLAAAARSHALQHGLIADAASMLALGGSLRGDVESLRAAYRELAACGAVVRHRVVARQLALLGAPVPSVATGGPLTARELEIVRLVARGATNAEIAQELNVSVKTVEASLTRTYAKTGRRTRVELAIAYEDGVLDAAVPADHT